MNNILLALAVILMFYILPIVTIKYFNRWTSRSERLIYNPPNGEDLFVSFCPLMNIVVACIIFSLWIMDKAKSTSNGRIKRILVKIIT